MSLISECGTQCVILQSTTGSLFTLLKALWWSSVFLQRKEEHVYTSVPLKGTIDTMSRLKSQVVFAKRSEEIGLKGQKAD